VTTTLVIESLMTVQFAVVLSSSPQCNKRVEWR